MAPTLKGLFSIYLGISVIIFSIMFIMFIMNMINTDIFNHTEFRFAVVISLLLSVIAIYLGVQARKSGAKGVGIIGITIGIISAIPYLLILLYYLGFWLDPTGGIQIL